MAKVILYRNKRDGVIHIRFNHNGSHASRSLPFKVEDSQWRDGRVVNHPNRDAMNISLTSILTAAQAELMRIVNSTPTRNKTPQDLRDAVCSVVFNDEAKAVSKSFYDVFDTFMNTHARTSTRIVYRNTLNLLNQFDRCADWSTIDVAWLEKFNQWMTRRKLSVNYRSIQLRNIRAVFNHAIDEGITTNYPFRKFKITSEEVESRDLTPEEWRLLYAYSHTAEGYVKQYVDLFVLQFLLLGINIVDLFNLKREDYKRGRIHYTRQKTGKKYNVKVHPMADEILNRYSGGEHLIAWMDETTNYRWISAFENKILKKVGKELGLSQRMSSYVSRYSWASIAYNDLDISMEVISQALGHSFGLKVTSGYINVNPKKVDDANEKVISYVFQKKDI